MISLRHKAKTRLAQVKPVLVLLFFCLSLGFLNIGLYVLLKPPIKLESTLPYTLKASDWEPISGNWYWQDGKLEQDAEGFALYSSPLRFELQPMRLLVKLEPGAGISFGMTHPYKLTGSQVIMLHQDSLDIGYVTLEDAWISQAQMPLPAASISKDYSLWLFAENGHYRLLLNGQTLGKDLPLYFTGTSLALLAEGRSSIRGLVIDRTVAEPVDTTAVSSSKSPSYSNNFSLPLPADWLVLSGVWQSLDGKLQQTQLEGFDHSILLPFPLNHTKVQVTLEHLQGVGGGILFGLNQPYTLAGAYLLRFEDRGDSQGIFWGQYDSQGVFVGQGDKALPEAKAKYRLELIFSENQVALNVDGIEVLSQPLSTPVSYMGFSSSLSRVAFDDLEIQQLGNP